MEWLFPEGDAERRGVEAVSWVLGIIFFQLGKKKQGLRRRIAF